MRSVVIKVAVATAVFAAIHSLLASTGAKREAAELLGRRDAQTYYRAIYSFSAFALTGLLGLYYLRQPRDELYRVRGAAAWAMRGGQALAAAGVLWAAYDVGSGFMLGLEPSATFHAGQGPVPNADASAMRATGPFAYLRQPLNLLILPLVWLNPSMSSRLLGFALAVSVYVGAGIAHSESHLADAYGDAYREYQRRVPLIPGVW